MTKPPLSSSFESPTANKGEENAPDSGTNVIGTPTFGSASPSSSSAVEGLFRFGDPAREFSSGASTVTPAAAPASAPTSSRFTAEGDGRNHRADEQEAPGSTTSQYHRSNSTDFEALTKKHVRPLIELNDRVNALIANENKINSTRIVVAGDQSHGKTSLLEALSGVDLPRGEGIQTRVPLVLQLREAADPNKEYALITITSSDDSPAEEISLDEICAKVQQYTARAAGPGKDVRDEPIELKIFRRDQDDLTLVDLPGITRVALGKNQAVGDGKKLETLILDMCRRYMRPAQSILLNVVSAMVDFSTSASLQLSRELDPTGKRTMLCITKVDQHREDGLHEKISAAMDSMNLSPQHVFAVRNRSQQENEDELPLEEVRRLEITLLERLTQGEVATYGLGVAALSKQLVKIQYEQIRQTLPHTKNTIDQRISDLNSKLQKLGSPIGDAMACRTEAVKLVDRVMDRLQSEVTGRVRSEMDHEDRELHEGDSLEVPPVTLEDIVAIRADDSDRTHQIEGASETVGSFSFNLQVRPRGDKESQNDKPVGVFLNITSSMTATLSVHITVIATSEDEIIKTVTCAEISFCTNQAQGWKTFISSKKANELEGSVTFSASVHVEKLVFDASTKRKKKDVALLCTQIADSQEELVSNIDTLYSNAYFFSEQFRMSLERDVSTCRGGTGLPGTIQPHIPVNVLRKLRLKLPAPIQAFRMKVLELCNKSVKNVICMCVDRKLHPHLHVLLVEQSQHMFNKQALALDAYHAKLLEWEETVCSSNHYFMDTVQSVRELLASEDRPSYLGDLDPDKIKDMSNEEQKLIDMQIEIFAYWKLMKKRLIDYIIMSTQSELVNNPIHKALKPALLEAVFNHGDNEGMVRLLSPGDTIVRERKKLSSRLVKLNKAREALEEFEMKKNELLL